jgi:hypothetical protein
VCYAVSCTGACPRCSTARIVFDAGRDPATGKRKQITRTCDRQKDAAAELARVSHQRATGVYVPLPS